LIKPDRNYLEIMKTCRDPEAKNDSVYIHISSGIVVK